MIKLAVPSASGLTPILNFILGLKRKFRTSQAINEEVWEWNDSTGKKRTLVVHRKTE